MRFGGMLQAKVDDLLGDIEGVKTYIDYILVLGKESSYNHAELLRFIFGRLCAASL